MSGTRELSQHHSPQLNYLRVDISTLQRFIILIITGPIYCFKPLAKWIRLI